MKNLVILVLLVLFTSCKKDEIKPTPCPTCPTEICTTNTHFFEGKYVRASDNNDTLIITYLNSNCSNYAISFYNIKNLKKVLKDTTNTLSEKDYVIEVNETSRSSNSIYFKLSYNTQGYRVGYADVTFSTLIPINKLP